jgi:hypothetical protein
VSALAIDSDDEALKRMLSAIAVDAKKRADVAEKEAVNTGSHATASKAFGEGKQFSADGDRLRGTQSHELAARRYWAATDRFEDAARTPPPPAPVAAAPPTRPQEAPATSNTAPSTANSSPSATPSAEKPKPYTPPAAPKPAPAAPESPAWSESQARAGVERLLDQYEAALEQLNVDAFKVLWPSMARETEQSLRRDLGGYRSVQVSISDCSREFTQNGTAATVICRERNQIKFRVGNNIDARYETRFTLRALGQSWVIVGWSRTALSR